MPLVSIGVPVYNAEKYLAETLDSVLARSVKDFELVISDNASTDRPAEICRFYQSKRLSSSLLLEQQRDCYIDSYGDVQGTCGDVMKPTNYETIAGLADRVSQASASTQT
jgi:GT2 family glycosyltransferase